MKGIRIKPLGKFILIVLALTIVVGGYMALKNSGTLEKIAPPEKQSIATTDGVEKSADAETKAVDNTPVIKVGVVTWGGYAGGEYFNGGFLSSKASRYYKEYGILVEFKLIDDYLLSRQAFQADEIDLLWTTADSIVTEVGSMKDQDIQIVMQSDWSYGGDAIPVTRDINSVADLKGKKIAVALGTPSHSLLLNTLDAGGLKYSDVQVITTDSAIVAAQMFKSGSVDAAVVWSPDDEDCIRTVPGSKILVSTKTADSIIADVFYAKKSFIDSHKAELKGLIEGWLKGAEEINNSASAKEEAIKILMSGLKIDEVLARKSIENVRLTNYSDNVNFFNLKGTYKGVKGEDLYNKMSKMYFKIGLCSANVPMWRTIVDTSILQSITTLQDKPETVVEFKAPTKQEETATAYASKPISIGFASNSFVLDENGKYIIDMEFTDIAKMFKSSKIRIEGNTDSVGSAAMNKELSLKRAQAVADYLVAKYEFDKNRFVIVGNGPDKPIASNDTDEGKAKNRRTEFFLLDK